MNIVNKFLTSSKSPKTQKFTKNIHQTLIQQDFRRFTTNQLFTNFTNN